MTTARSIIEGALGFGLNRLSPGETLDADTASSCLSALNMLCDEFNGSETFLFRDIATAGTSLSSASGTLGGTWATLTPGTKITGATYFDGYGDAPLIPMDFAQYRAIYDKTLVTGEPEYYSHDGYATVYFYPTPVAAVITLLTRQTFSTFADLDTDYGMPQGYKAAFSDLLAEKMAFQLLGQIPQKVARDAAAARRRLMAKNMQPAIIQPGYVSGNILSGW